LNSEKEEPFRLVMKDMSFGVACLYQVVVVDESGNFHLVEVSFKIYPLVEVPFNSFLRLVVARTFLMD